MYAKNPLRAAAWPALTVALWTACGGATPNQPAAPAARKPVHVPGTFADNPVIYFVMTDRFVNGDPSNDHSYGRQREAKPEDDVGTFHGGDLRGLTQKLEAGYFDQLGVNALWITAPYEQIHGWVVGGDKEFKHYAYHGYYALDYTLLDQNMGTPDDLKKLVDTAHAHGIRVLFDVVMNHPGYLDITTAQQLGLKVLWPGAEKATLTDYHQLIDYNNFAFGTWWGRAWVRAGLPGYTDGGRDDLTSQLAYLPDFRTESKDEVTLPQFLKAKKDTRAVDLPHTTVRGYLIKWLTDWVRTYGIDGFRCDTVKHVEPEAWTQLKKESTAALAEWKAAHPRDKIDDAAFWMVGEFWGLGPARGPLHDAGFDAMINFEFQQRAKLAITSTVEMDKLFADYAGILAGKPAQALNYLSSHDTELFDRQKLLAAGEALLLAPGAAQIYYGDESARPPGPQPRTDAQQATRSDMNWTALDERVLAHWRKLGRFRRDHVAVANGAHAKLGDKPYTFSRVSAADHVVVALDASPGMRVPVGTVFKDGETVHDAYTDATYVVAGGAVTVTVPSIAVLLEAVAR